MKLLYSILITVFPSLIFAQLNYQKGYILKNNGDTVKGYIDYREWFQSPDLINFKLDKTDKKVQQFSPQNIKGFQITGMDTYISYSGTISMDKTNFPDIPDGLDTTKKLDTIFLKQLVTGSHLTFFQHKDHIKTRFFIAEKDDEPIELRHHEYYNNQKQVVNSDVYKGQLLLYINKFFPDNERLIGKVERVPYEQSDLESLVDEINNNKIVNKKAATNRLFVGFSLNRTDTKVNDIDDLDGALVTHHITMSPKINLGIDLFNNPKIQQTIFRIELSFSYINPRLLYPATVNTVTTNGIYSFNQYTAAITPQILFNFYNKEKLNVYIDGGVAFNLSTYSNNKFTFPDINPVIGAIEITPYKLEPLWVSIPIQAGVIVNRKIEFSFMYIPNASYTKYPEFYVDNSSMNLAVKFLFSRR